MKGWDIASSATPCTAKMSHGAAVKRQFMLMVEKAGVTDDNEKQGETLGCVVEDTDYQFNNVMNDNFLDINSSLFLL